MSHYMDNQLGCRNVNTQVSTLLKNGWELYGMPFSCRRIKCQAMVKYDNSTPLEATFHIGKEKNDVK